VHVAPLKILFGDESYRSGIDITHEQFYARLAQGDVHPTTSQPTVPDFVELYRSLGASGAPILSIHISEGLSGTVNVARQAAQQLPDLNITVHDSGTLSAAEGFQVLVAARALEAGRPERHPAAARADARRDQPAIHRGRPDVPASRRADRLGPVPGRPVAQHQADRDRREARPEGGHLRLGGPRAQPGESGRYFHRARLGSRRTGRQVARGSGYGSDSEWPTRSLERLKREFDLVYGAAIPDRPGAGVHVAPARWGDLRAGDWPV